MAVCKESRDCVHGHRQETTSCDGTGTLGQTKQRGAEKYRLSSCASKNGVPASLPGCQLWLVWSDGNPASAPMATDLVGRSLVQNKTGTDFIWTNLTVTTAICWRWTHSMGVSLLFSSLLLDITAYEHCDVCVALYSSWRSAVGSHCIDCPCCLGSPSEGKVLPF